MISPEGFPTWDERQSLAADLLVTEFEKSDDGTPRTSPVLTYEGKSGLSNRDWPAIRDQIRLWCERGNQISTFCCWGIGTKGGHVAFFVWDGNNNTLHGLEIGDNNGNPVLRRHDPLGDRTRDITNNNDWPEIAFALRVMSEHPNITSEQIGQL